MIAMHLAHGKTPFVLFNHVKVKTFILFSSGHVADVISFDGENCLQLDNVLVDANGYIQLKKSNNVLVDAYDELGALS